DMGDRRGGVRRQDLPVGARPRPGETRQNPAGGGNGLRQRLSGSMSTAEVLPDLAAIAGWLRAARSVRVLIGAGVSTASGTRDILIEIHGTMRDVVCLACGERGPAEPTFARVRAGEEDPACRTCGGILKSATISFGQSLVAEDLQRAEMAAAACDVFLAVGSS